MSTTILAEAVRFELTDPFGSSVFKTGAISRTLPHFQLFGPSHNKQCSILIPFKRYADIIENIAVRVGPSCVSCAYTLF